MSGTIQYKSGPSIEKSPWIYNPQTILGTSNHSNHSNQYSDNSRSEDNNTPRFHSDFIGENVFLTAEPFEEMKGQGQGQGQEEYSDNNVDRAVETGLYVCACVFLCLYGL